MQVIIAHIAPGRGIERHAQYFQFVPQTTQAIVAGSTVARNTGFDFNQQPGGVLRSSGNNALTGRGAPDINGATTFNQPK